MILQYILHNNFFYILPLSSTIIQGIPFNLKESYNWKKCFIKKSLLMNCRASQKFFYTLLSQHYDIWPELVRDTSSVARGESEDEKHEIWDIFYLPWWCVYYFSYQRRGKATTLFNTACWNWHFPPRRGKNNNKNYRAYFDQKMKLNHASSTSSEQGLNFEISH